MGLKKIYEAYGLNKEQALELLRTKAFKSKKNDSSYDYILNRAVKYASGLPLALEVVGSNLFGKSIAECESLLDKYDRIPHEDIQKILKVSYDALAEEQQSVFLDIACVFKGRGKEYVQEVLHDHYGYCIKSHIGVLVDKSLIKINGKYIGRVTLHDLIEDMGMEIVRQESIKEPGKRSRLWCRDDIVHVLQEKKGTSKIEMIYLNSPSMKPVDMNEKAFKKMTNLKTLIIEKGNFSKGPKYLPSSLVFCKWIGCPSKTLSFLSNKNFEDMKHLILDRSQSLIHIPNVSSLQNLIKFSFENCRNLIKIDNSIWKLNKLEHLSAKGCLKLESFPPLHLPSLKELELSKCDSLKSFPELLCQMTNIKEINLCDTSIGEFPFSFQYLSELVFLQVNRVRMLRFQKYNDRMNPIMFSKMYSVILGETNLSDECLPILLKLFVNVTSLKLMKNNFKILPECLSECHRLGELVLDDCKFLEEIRGIPPNLGRLSALRCESLSLESRRRLLSQDLHEAGCTKISFPNGSEGIPDWFEHQRKGDTFSFWYRKKIPTITCIFLVPGSALLPEFNLFVNDKEIEVTECLVYYNDDELLASEHAFLFDMNLDCHIEQNFTHEPELYEALKNDEWNHVELNWEICMTDTEEEDFSDTEEDDWSEMKEKEIIILSSGTQMGIHVSWNAYDCGDMEVEKSNKEGEVRFTNPYSRKRKLVEVGVSEIEENEDFSDTEGDETEILSSAQMEEEDDVLFTNPYSRKIKLVELGVSETEEDENFK